MTLDELLIDMQKIIADNHPIANAQLNDIRIKQIAEGICNLIKVVRGL